MHRFVFILLLSLNAFAFYPVYHSPSDWLKRSFPDNFFASPSFSGKYSTNGLGLLVSQRGALYFKHTDFRFDYVDDGYPFSDYFLTKFNFYVPADVLKSTHVLSPVGITYTNIFADNATSLNGTSLGILMTFGKPVTLESIDNSCLVPVSAFYELANNYGNYMYFDGGDTYFNSPLIMNSGDEPCKNSFLGGYFDLSPNMNVQTVYLSYYEKVSEPCPDNHIFRANSDKSITCEPCPSSTYSDVFKNICVTKISSITNPFDYAKAQCFSTGSSLKYIEDSLNIVNGGDNFYCETICNNGTKINNYNCPERINFGDIINYEPNCIKGNCGNGEGSQNTSSNNYPYDKPYQPPSNSQKVEVSENEKGKICFSDDNCISIGGATVNDDKQICINGNCSNINSGSDRRDNTVCINGDCYHLGNNGSINHNQICINGNCSSINSSISNGNNGASGNGGSVGSGVSGNGGSAGSGVSGSGSNDNNNGLVGLCQNGECGNYDNSSLNSYFSTLDGLSANLGSFKENLEGTYNNFKESVENTKKIFDNGFLNFRNTGSLKSCPLVFDYELGNGGKQNFNLDLCEFLFPFSNLFYLIFYIFFSAIALLFSYKILKDVFHLILNSRSS
ncbi:Uncharacterised protein [Campylobacter jejuni subsp. doylei]|nr:Uncharacterised protein [Campylobacter jejuni subsp. doylei]